MHRLSIPSLLLAFLAGCDGPSASDKPGDTDETDADTDTDTDPPVDADGDGYGDTDCDDSSAVTHPGADERCDGLDNDCDGDVDEDPVDGDTYYADLDGDGAGDASAPVAACEGGAGIAANAEDCDDSDATRYPGADESCDDPVDRNCDGSVGYVDADGDGWAACTECDDGAAGVNPDAVEVCDAANVDEDCSGAADDEDAAVSEESRTTWYRDPDADGYGDASGVTTVACEAPDGFVADATDCDSADAAVNPGATEVCDDADVDEDCSGAADDGDAGVASSSWSTWYEDADGDGFGDDGATVSQCEAPSGFVATGGDCDDADPAVSPGATEECDGATDEDCDGLVDDADPGVTGTSTWYLDADGDGWGDPAATLPACVLPAGYVDDATDCDDGEAGTNPGAEEACDADDRDEDCDGAADDADPSAVGQTSFYADVDADGYGDGAAGMSSCDAAVGYVADGTDCDDVRAGVNPGATEACDADDLDEDCDGLADDADASVTGLSSWYTDADADGYGTGVALSRCEAPVGYGTAAGDCDDADADEHPGAAELCDGSDDDCDGLTDDADPDVADATTWYRDVDNDGYGGSGTRVACSRPSGYVGADGDCDDLSSAVSPGVPEVCDASDVDEDCDGLADDADGGVTGTSTWYADVDGDGYGASGASLPACSAPGGYVADATDCNDLTTSISPAAIETCNALDDDCDGTVDDGVNRYYPDYDGDGYGDAADPGSCTASSGTVTDNTDCDESASGINPAASEICDSTDNDCDGLVDDDDTVDVGTSYYVDDDEDGYGADDVTPRVGCSSDTGETAVGGDCDDGDAEINPGESEHYGDYVDDDCDGSTTSGAPTKTRITGDQTFSSSVTYSDTWFTGAVTVTLGTFTCYRCRFSSGVVLETSNYAYRDEEINFYAYDSYFAGGGVYTYAQNARSSYDKSIDATISGCTFDGGNYAVYVSRGLYATATVRVSNTFAFDARTDYFYEASGNLYESNNVTTANESAYVDTSYTPPRPIAGSSLIGASTSTSSTDYWGVARTDADIGAVER